MKLARIEIPGYKPVHRSTGNAEAFARRQAEETGRRVVIHWPTGHISEIRPKGKK